jgi:hypothetical protein
MGNSISKEKSTELKDMFHCCTNYKHSDVVHAVYSILSEYQIEAMCDCASWILREILIKHRQYPDNQVDLVCGRFNETYHVWVHDKIENYYIDITSEQFDIPKCFCSQDINEFKQLGYKITNEESTQQICKSICCEPYVLFDKGKKITRIHLFNRVKKLLGIVGGKRNTKKHKFT